MSEFVSVCPQCRQRILCDSEFVGKRVACPICLQEIAMPEPPPKPLPPAPGHSAAASRSTISLTTLTLTAITILMLVGVAAYALVNRSAAGQKAAPLAPASALANPPAAVPLAPGRYKIINRLTGLCVDVNTNGDMARAVLARYNGSQVWDVRLAENNAYSLNFVPIHGLSLQLATTPKTGEQLEAAKWVHVPRQLWTLLPLPGGCFEITHSGHVMDVVDNTADSGQPVIQNFSPQGGLHQQWIFQAP